MALPENNPLSSSHGATACIYSGGRFIPATAYVYSDGSFRPAAAEIYLYEME